MTRTARKSDRSYSADLAIQLAMAIDRVREERGLSVAAVAKRARISVGQLRGLMSGTARTISLVNLGRVMDALGIDIELLQLTHHKARTWQVAQAWADAKKIAAGARTKGDWSKIHQAGDAARKRIREREAAADKAALADAQRHARKILRMLDAGKTTEFVHDKRAVK